MGNSQCYEDQIQIWAMFDGYVVSYIHPESTLSMRAKCGSKKRTTDVEHVWTKPLVPSGHVLGLRKE